MAELSERDGFSINVKVSERFVQRVAQGIRRNLAKRYIFTINIIGGDK